MSARANPGPTGGDDPVVTPVDGPGAAGDEVVHFGGPRRRPPRWVWVAAAVALGGLVAGLLLSRTGQRPQHPVAAVPLPSGGQPSTFGAPPEVPVDLPGTPIPLPSSARPVDLALGARGLYVLQADGTVVRVEGGTMLAAETVPGPSHPAQRLLVDEAAQRSWALSGAAVQITAQSGPGAVTSRTVRLPGQVFGATLLRGTLWVASSSGVYVVSPDAGAAVRVPGYGGGAFAIAADPAHDRLVAVSDAYPSHVIAVRTDPAGAALLTRSPLPLGKTTIAVTAKGIWVGGFGDGPRVVRLDPGTLRPHGSSDVRVGPGAAVWPGESVVWVHAGDGSDQLYCVDAASGRELASWPGIDGPVVSRSGAAYAIVGNAVVRLNLPSTCPG